MTTHPLKHARMAIAGAMVTVCTCTEAQLPLMRDVFSQLPDTLLPTMSRNNRLDMVDFVESGMKAVVTDRLDGRCVMDTLTADYARISMGGSLSVELKVLPTSAQLPDSSACIVCLVKTFGSQTKESSVDFFTEKWRPLPVKLTTGTYTPQLIVRPDTITAERFAEICPDTSLLMVAAALSPAGNTLTLTPQMPLQTDEERKETAPLLRSLTLKWTGKEFK